MTARRYRGLLAVLLLLVLGTAGCGFVGTLIETQDALEEAGYRVSDLDVSADYGAGTTVTVRLRPRAETTESWVAEASGAAKVVWEVAAFRVDAVVLVPDAGSTLLEEVAYSRTELEQQFGPRPASLDEKSIEELFDVGAILKWVAIGGAALLAVVVLVVVLIVRAVRRKPAAPAYAGYPPPFPPPPPPGGPQGWSPYPGAAAPPPPPYGAPPPVDRRDPDPRDPYRSPGS